MEYTNRHGNIFTFTKQEDGNVLWEGPFEYIRVGDDFVDPSGGPFIQKGQVLSDIIYDNDFNLIVEAFESVDTGYLIKCGYDQSNESLLRRHKTKLSSEFKKNRL